MSAEVIPLSIGRAADAAQATDIELLFQSHSESVFRYLRALIGGEDEALDLTALTFERALGQLQRPGTEVGIGWLLRTARNAAIDAARRRRTEARTNERLGWAADEASTEQAAVAAESRRELRAALAQLSQPQREAIALRYSTDLPVHEIARLIGKSEAATQKLIGRGLGRLKEILDDPG